MKSKDNAIKDTLDMLERTYYCWGEYSNGNLCPYRHSCGCYLNQRPQKTSVGKMTPMQPPGNAACIFFVKAKKDNNWNIKYQISILLTMIKSMIQRIKEHIKNGSNS